MPPIRSLFLRVYNCTRNSESVLCSHSRCPDRDKGEIAGILQMAQDFLSSIQWHSCLLAEFTAWTVTAMGGSGRALTPTCKMERE